jgi:hypothetical protein
MMRKTGKGYRIVFKRIQYMEGRSKYREQEERENEGVGETEKFNAIVRSVASCLMPYTYGLIYFCFNLNERSKIPFEIVRSNKRGAISNDILAI